VQVVADVDAAVGDQCEHAEDERRDRLPDPWSARRPAWPSRVAPAPSTSGTPDQNATGRSCWLPLEVVELQRTVATRLGASLVAAPSDQSNGGEAIALAAAERPDVVLMDLRMPGVDGIDATRAVTAVDDPPRVLVFTTFDLDEVVYDALRPAPAGSSSRTPPKIGWSRRSGSSRGGSLFAPAVTRRLIEEFARRPRPRTSPALATLTDRESEVLRLVARGRLSNQEIAAELFETENTVKTHVARVLMKLSLRDRVQAVVLAYESEMVPPN
jgi:DNA-binding NarL/FixJ family response regulator